LDVGGNAELLGASGGDDEVRQVEWSSMVVVVVQIGARWRVGGRLELAMTAEIVRTIPATRCTICCRVWWRRERRGGRGIYRGARLAEGARV
jgi:hypothetical protein